MGIRVEKSHSVWVGYGCIASKKPLRNKSSGQIVPFLFPFEHQDFLVKKDTKIMWNQILTVPVCGTVSKRDGRRKGLGKVGAR